MCAAQDSPQPRPLRGEKHPFPSRSSCASMRYLCRPNWVCFFFSAFPQFLASTSLEWRQNQFSLSWGLTAAPGFAHNRLTRLQQGRQPVSLVLLPYLAPKTAHRPSRGRIHFFSPERVYPPPLGGGAGYLLSWVRRVCPARSKLTHTGPTGPTLFLAGVASLPGPQNRTQGHTRPSLILTAVFWCALGLVKLPNHAPACNLLPLG